MPTLPPVGVLVMPVTCIPTWMTKYLQVPNTAIPSGYSVNAAGNVPASPAALAKAAGVAIARNSALPPEIRARGGDNVTLAVYTLARYVSSEVGASAIGDAVAVLQDGVNQAARRNQTVVDLLVYTAKSANRGFYGPINVKMVDGTYAPFGRWAATSKDPTVRAIVLAQDVLIGAIPASFNKGGDDQADITSYKYPERKIRELGAANAFWVGQLPLADHRRSMHFRTIKGLDAATRELLITRGVKALNEPSTNWTALRLPACPENDAGNGEGRSPIGPISGGGMAALVIGSAALAAAGGIAYAVHRRRLVARG